MLIEYYSDGFKIKGDLHLPDITPCPIIIGSHGLLSDRNSPKQIDLANAVNRIGIAYLRIDHRGCGDSDGDFNTVTSLEGRGQDMVDAIHTMTMRKDINGKIGLFGSSMGGAACLACALCHPVDVMITYAAPVNSISIVQSFESSGKSLDLPQGFDYHDLHFDIKPRLKNIKNIMVVHGQNDDVVPQTHAQQIFNASLEPKKLIIQKGGDHPMSDPTHQSEFMQAALEWYRMFLI